MSSDRLEALINQIEALMQAKRYEEAIIILQQSLQVDPNNTRMLERYADSLVKIGQLEQSSVIFQKILKTAPNDIALISLVQYSSSSV